MVTIHQQAPLSNSHLAMFTKLHYSDLIIIIVEQVGAWA